METGGNVNEIYFPSGVHPCIGNSMLVKTFCLIVEATLAFFVSPAVAKDPRSLGLQLPPGVVDPRLCPEGTTRTVQFAGPGYEQLCVKSSPLGTPIKHGPCMVWYGQNKQKYLEGTYQEGKPHRSWTFWHDNGQKERQGLYREGQPEGSWTLWNRDGRKVEVEFHHGEAIHFSPSLEEAFSIKGFALGIGNRGETAPLLCRGKEIQGQIVDAVTGQPIAGAIVVIHWEIHSESMVNPGNVRLHISEAFTDENGQYILPEWRKLRPPLTSLSLTPTLTILKSGYRPHIASNDILAYPSAVPASDWHRKTITLERPTETLEEQAAYWRKIYRGLSTNGAADDPNDWKHFPRATVEAHKEERRLLALGLNPRRSVNIVDLDRLSDKDREFLRRFE